MSHRHIVLIAGMHRSGTSALCAALARCGVSFGTDLLDPMAGVNEEGFWEDTAVVQLNQQLLQRASATWFSLPDAVAQTDWSAAALADLQEAAQAVLRRGFGSGTLQALKDPRLCITMPFWLAACAALQLPVTVCVMHRAPLEVARSLQRRDGFPLGYGLRLYAQYRQLLMSHLPAGTVYVTYDSLLRDPASVMQALARTLPLVLPRTGLLEAVKPQLRHCQEVNGNPVLLDGRVLQLDLAVLNEAIDQAFPDREVHAQFALCLVERAEQLTRLGAEHAQALATITQRDADVEKLSALHRAALATIDERDAQITEFDRRLAATGAHLAEALDTLNERDRQLRQRDEQLQRIRAIPGVRLVLRVQKWLHEKR